MQGRCHSCKTAYCYSNLLYEMPFFVILVMVIVVMYLDIMEMVWSVGEFCGSK